MSFFFYSNVSFNSVKKNKKERERADDYLEIGQARYVLEDKRVLSYDEDYCSMDTMVRLWGMKKD